MHADAGAGRGRERARGYLAVARDHHRVPERVVVEASVVHDRREHVVALLGENLCAGWNG